MNLYSGLIHNHQNWTWLKMAFSWWMDKQMGIHKVEYLSAMKENKNEPQKCATP